MEVNKSQSKYTYNAMNQLISRVDSAIDDKQGQLNGNIIKEEHYTYDKRGNLTETYQGNNLINQYHFGALNRLEKAVNHQTKEASEYIYNGLGNRVGRTIGAPVEVMLPTEKLDTLTINPMNRIEDTIDLTKQYHNLLQRTEDSNTTAFTWDSNVLHAIGGGEETSSNERNNSYNQYLQDELGSPIRLFSPNGDMEELYSYDEFGQELYNNQSGKAQHISQQTKQQTNMSQPFTYTGYQRDSVANTYYAQAREYKAQVGRFTSEDIIKGSIIYPDTINHYAYCWNSPMDLVDLDGMKPRVAFLIGVMHSIIHKEYWDRMKAKEVPDYSGIDASQLPDYTDMMQEFVDKKVKEYEEYAKDHNVIDITKKFYNDVKTGGDMDIKDIDSWKKHFGNTPNTLFVFNGKIVDPTMMGNVTYAYLGKALNDMNFKGPDTIMSWIYSEVGLIAGGWAETKSTEGPLWLSLLMPLGGEAPEDVPWLLAGFQWYDNMPMTQCED